MNSAFLSINQQHTIDLEGNQVFEELSTGCRRAQARCRFARFDLRDVPAPATHHEVIRAQRYIQRFAVHNQRIAAFDLCSEHVVTQSLKQVRSLRLGSLRPQPLAATDPALVPTAGRHPHCKANKQQRRSQCNLWKQRVHGSLRAKYSTINDCGQQSAKSGLPVAAIAELP